MDTIIQKILLLSESNVSAVEELEGLNNETG